MPQYGIVVTGQAHLNRGFLDGALLQFAEEDTCENCRVVYGLPSPTGLYITLGRYPALKGGAIFCRADGACLCKTVF